MSPVEPVSVAVLASRFRPERYGGVEERLWRMTRGLARAGVDVLVIAETTGNAPQTETFEPGLRIQRVPARDTGRMWRLYYGVKAEHWRRAAAAVPPAASIWATEPSMVLGARLARPRSRLVFQPAACAAGMHHIWKRRPHIYTMKVPLHLRLIDRLAYWLADDVVVSSANVQRQFETFYGRRARVHVIPFGGDNDEPRGPVRTREAQGIAPHEFAIGFVGRLDPCKDLPFLLDAIAAMPNREQVKLIIVGTGPDQERVTSLVEASGLVPNVLWAGRVDDPREFLPLFDVLVLPSVYEAFGLVLLEAMAEGVPVIGRKDDGDSVFTATDEIVKEGAGIVVSVENPGILATALQSLREAPDRRRAMGDQAARVARAWTWEHAATACLRVLRTS